MRGCPADFWAKIDKNAAGEVDSWHPLVDHCADVAACCYMLLSTTILRRRLVQLVEYTDLDEQQISRISVLAGLHDIGKFNHGFQNKAERARHPRAGHVREVLALIEDEQYASYLAEALDFDNMAEWVIGETGTCQLLISSLCHHGKPESLDVRLCHILWRKSANRNPLAGIAHLTALTKQWFPMAWLSGGAPLPDEPRFQHALNGVITLADWLGSDKRFFGFSHDSQSELIAPLSRFLFSKKQAKKAMESIGIDTIKTRESLGEKRPSFDAVSSFSPRPIQELLLALAGNEEGSVVVLESETGSGKTEAALGRFLVLFQQSFVDGMYFALPTRTAASQIHRRVVEVVQRAFPDEQYRPPVVLAVPGYIRVDEVEGKRLPGFEVLWHDDDKERFRYRGWAAEHPKRYLAGAIVIGTIDQVLLSTLTVSHSHMRASALLRHFLVVDEVHASDAYMNRLLEVALQRHVQVGGHALLMSATLGSEARNRLLHVCGFSKGESSRETLKSAQAVSYPLVSHQLVSGPAQYHGTENLRSLPIKIELWPAAADYESIVSRTLNAAQAGAKVLVLRNTVSDCVATQNALEALALRSGAEQYLFSLSGVHAPHHSRFCRQDRQALDDAIENIFGKERSRGGCVVVTTQTVQQSLDLDADILFTDLCPMDVLLQRLGRLHRHHRDNRPPGFEHAKAIVLTLKNRTLTELIQPDGAAAGPHGLGWVYEDLRIIEASWRVLEQYKELTIPKNNRALVELAIHSEILDKIVQELGEPWMRHERFVKGGTTAEKRLAQLNVADWSLPFCDGRSLFPSKELSRKIQTRLGEGDRLVNFSEELSGPFGLPFKYLTIPAHLVRSAGEATEATCVTSVGGQITFCLGEQLFVYDRLGLRRNKDAAQ